MLLTIILLLILAVLLFHKKRKYIILSILCRISAAVYSVLNKKVNCETIKDFKIVTFPFMDKFCVDNMFTSCSIFFFSSKFKSLHFCGSFENHMPSVLKGPLLYFSLYSSFDSLIFF